MASITIYGGAGEIGGNKILLKDGRGCVALDFGMSMGHRAAYFQEFLKPRAGYGLFDLLALGLVPPLDGIYRDDLTPRFRRTRGLALPGMAACRLDAVLLSHAHVDHSAYLSFLDPDIPVYATAMTAMICKASQDTAPADQEREVCYISRRRWDDGRLHVDTTAPLQQRRFVFLDEEQVGPEARSFWNTSPMRRKGLQPTAAGKRSSAVGGMRFEVFPTDHSVPGCVAFAVETRAGWVVYTGDVRRHGAGGAMTDAFIAAAAKLEPAALLCEGTRIESISRTSEAEVFERALEVVKGTKGLVVADFGPRNVERLMSFQKIAHETSRQLLILPKDAYLLSAMQLVSERLPGPAGMPDVGVYRETAGAGQAWQEQVMRTWAGRWVEPGAVAKRPGDYILCLSFFDIQELMHLNTRHGVYIYSTSEPYTEEQAFDFRRLRNWLCRLGMTLRGDTQAGDEAFHASGHASGPDLLHLVRTISPKRLIPIHTEHPETFVAHLTGEGIEVVVPDAGVEIEVR